MGGSPGGQAGRGSRRREHNESGRRELCFQWSSLDPDGVHFDEQCIVPVDLRRTLRYLPNDRNHVGGRPTANCRAGIGSSSEDDCLWPEAVGAVARPVLGNFLPTEAVAAGLGRPDQGIGQRGDRDRQCAAVSAPTIIIWKIFGHLYSKAASRC